MPKVMISVWWWAIATLGGLFCTANAFAEDERTAYLEFSSATSSNTSLGATAVSSGSATATSYQTTNAGSSASVQRWAFSARANQFVAIPFDDDLSIPIPIAAAEVTLSNPDNGLIQFTNGSITSVTRTPVDILTLPAGETARLRRPTLFVSVAGLAYDETLQCWQHGSGDCQTNNLAFKLSRLIVDSQYKYFAVQWDSAHSILGQDKALADYIKVFLNSKSHAWDVVLIGYSRGGIVAHQLAQRLAGHAKISKLHTLLLDPTASPTLGDLYPTRNVGGNYGYLKYDGQPFFYHNAGTVADQNIDGYDNYGRWDFYATALRKDDPSVSHMQFPENWLINTGVDGFDTALQQIANRQDSSGGPFTIEGNSGFDIVQVHARNNSGDLTAQCSDSACTLQGSINVGQFGNLSFNNVVATDGVDLAVATTAGAASVVIRRDQLSLMQTDVFTGTQQDLRIDRNGISSNTSSGGVAVSAQLGLSGASVNVTVLGQNLDLVNVGPLDAVVPGATQAKTALKKAFK